MTLFWRPFARVLLFDPPLSLTLKIKNLSTSRWYAQETPSADFLSPSFFPRGSLLDLANGFLGIFIESDLTTFFSQ